MQKATGYVATLGQRRDHPAERGGYRRPAGETGAKPAGRGEVSGLLIPQYFEDEQVKLAGLQGPK